MPRTKQVYRQKPGALQPRLSLAQIVSIEAEDDSDFTMPMKGHKKGHKKHQEAQQDIDNWASTATSAVAPATSKKKRKRSSSKSMTSGRYAFLLLLHVAYI